MTIKKASRLINVFTLCIVILTIGLLLYLGWKIEEVNSVAANRFYSILLVDELRKSSEELTRQVRNYAATGSQTAEDAYNKVLAVRDGQAPRPVSAWVAPGQKRVLLDLLKEYGITDEEFALVEKANSLSDALVALEVKAMNAVKGIFMDAEGKYTIHSEPDRELAMSLVFGPSYDEEVKKIMAPMAVFEEHVSERTAKTMKDSMIEQYNAEYFAIAVLILALIFAILNMIFNQIIIVGPLHLVTDILKTVSVDGKTYLDKRINIRHKNEIGGMAEFFNTTFESIKDLIGVIKSKTDALTHSSLTLSSNMNETAAAIHQISSNIDSMKNLAAKQENSASGAGTTAENIKNNIDNLNNLIEEQAERINTSSSAVEEMTANIHSVTQTLFSDKKNVEALAIASENGRAGLQTVAQDIQEIARESDGLLKINSVMENIASQTNLLSMNAAIEAAHAGAAGKGFAVVADEIRKLAESSGEQSKVISVVLKKIKTSIDNITKSAEEVLARFQAIDTSVKTVSEHEQNIRNAMEEQETGGKQILESISRMNEITASVKKNSKAMADDGTVLVNETSDLMIISRETLDAMNEMAGGVNQINMSVNEINDMSMQNKTNIGDLELEMDKFCASS